MMAVPTAGGTFLAQCDQCGQWLEVEPEVTRVDLHFSYWEGPFSCCSHWQTASFVVEKDETDIH